MRGGEINMAQNYYVNRNSQANGDHEVHTTGCPTPPNPENRRSLGNHENCRTAVAKSKREFYEQSNGCRNCCTACHTQ